MSEYYAVVRSSDCLVHYGIKGMHWGVRKAIQRNDERALSRQYKKASKKLAKLNKQADIKYQNAAVEKHDKRARIALGVGAAGAGVLAGNRLYAKHLASKITKHIKPPAETNTTVSNVVNQTVRKKRIVGEGKGIEKHGEGLGTGPVGQNPDGLKNAINGNKTSNGFRTVHKIATGVAAAGLGTAAYQLGKAGIAKYRTTAKGHAKAVAKRDAFQREMNKTFAGTKYGSKKKRR